MLKQCTKCQQWKPTSEFHKNKSRKDGLNSWCKSCAIDNAHKWYQENTDRALEIARKWALAHLDKVKEAQRKWLKNNPDKKREHSLKATHKWRAKHPEQSLEIGRRWKANNPDRVRDYTRRYLVENPDKVRESQSRYDKNHRDRRNANLHNYRARKKGNGGKITSQEWQWLKEFYNNTCLCCCRQEPEIKLTLDHVKPLKLGGKNIIQNAQPLCRSCNASKGAKEIDYRPKRKLM